MPDIKKILFPVDFSRSDLAAARYVECLARPSQAQIMLLHVVDTTSHGEIVRRPERLLYERLETFLADELKPLSLERVCRIGDPAKEIVKIAQTWAPDLIMMPSYGMGFYRPALIGSVTAKVLHDAACPVWTSVHAEQPLARETGFAKVLCALDLQERSPQILEWAIAFTRMYRAELGVTHSAPMKDGVPMAAQAHRRVDALLANADAKAAVLINSGDPPSAVACAATNFGAGLVIIGRHGGGGEGHLRQNAYGIIRQSPCPVISI